MLDLIKGSLVVVASSIPLEKPLSIPETISVQPYIYHEYKSHTMNYNPFYETEEKILNELIEKTFILNQ